MTAVALPQDEWIDVEAWVIGVHLLPVDAPEEAHALWRQSAPGMIIVGYDDGTWEAVTPVEFAANFEWV